MTVMPFEQIAIEEIGETPTDYMSIILTVLKYLVPLIVAAMFFLIVFRPLIRSLTTPVPARRQVPGRAGSPGDMAQLEEPLQAKQIPMEKQVIDWAAGNPRGAAGLVKGWLEEK